MENASADRSTAEQNLDRARRLTSQVQGTTRWYARYLVLFAIMSFVIATLFAFVRGSTGAMVLTSVWLVFVIGLSIWQSRQKAMPTGITRLHLWVIGAWAAAWSLTVLVGSSLFRGDLAWWMSGGVLMAIAPLVGARVVLRRTRA